MVGRRGMSTIPRILLVDNQTSARATCVGISGRFLAAVDYRRTPAEALELMRTITYAGFIFAGFLGEGQLWGPELLNAFRAEQCLVNRETPACFLAEEPIDELTARAGGVLQGPHFVKRSPADWEKIQNWLMEIAGIERRDAPRPTRKTGT